MTESMDESRDESLDESLDESMDLPKGIRLLGSEMFTWSDLAGEVGAPDGPLLLAFLERVLRGRRGHALIVGPHHSDLVAAVARTFTTTEVLVRSLPDAQRLRAELPDPSIAISCGAFAAFAPAPGDAAAYDLVIALDGLGRLLSSDEERLPWPAVVERLVGLRARDGELLLGIGNPTGVDHLLALEAESHDTDAHWPLGRRVVDEIPWDLTDLTERLGSWMPDLALDTWVAHGPRLSPALIATADTARRFRRDGVFATLVERAARRSASGHRSVREPGSVARRLLHHGLGLETAPLWIFHGRSQAAAGDAFLSLDLTSGEPGVAVAVTPGASGWARELVTDPAPSPQQVAPDVVRELGLLAGPVPTGTFVYDDLAECCLVQDLSAAGAIVRRYRDWLAEPTAARAEGGRSYADPAKAALTLDLIVDTGAELAAFDPSLRAQTPATVEEIVTRTLLAFAEELLASGRRHGWPLSYGADQIARALVAAAGIEVDADGVERARELDVALRLGRPAGSPSAVSYAEALELLDRYRAHAADAEQQVEWLLVNIHRRQRWLMQARRRQRELRGSAEYRLGKRILWARERGRRWRARIRRWRDGPAPVAGEWRQATVTEREPIVVDPELLPPGYEQKGPML